MIFPYRVKNPPRSIPFVTYSIMAVNLIVYIFTSESLLSIKEGVLHSYGFQLGVTPFYTALTAEFLHANPLHILGNLWFLWLFGPSVEDRLKPHIYAVLYLVTGVLGFYLQDIVTAISGGPSLPGIGASGSIMGVAGAYVYLFTWSTVCVWYWFWLLWRGVWEVAAVWVIGFYLVSDIWEGFQGVAMGVSGGVANFAHIGGIAFGVLACVLLRAQRDTPDLSDARAIHADAGGDIRNMPAHALSTMLEHDSGNPELIRALIPAALRLGGNRMIPDAFEKAGPGLVEKDPNLVAYYLNDLQGDPRIYRPVQILRLAGTMERYNEPVTAISIYQLLMKTYPESPEVEPCLYRAALCTWNTKRDGAAAKKYLYELGKRYPQGEMIEYAKNLWRQIG